MKTNNLQVDVSQRLIQLGVLLFVLGLLTGFAIPLMESPRMGLSSHLEGVLNGLVLIVLGLSWHRLSLPGWASRVAPPLAVFGTFANWLATLLAGIWGAGRMTPIAGGGATGTPSEELVVAALLIALSLAMLALGGLLLWGFARHRAV